jgi:hypothetical protein
MGKMFKNMKIGGKIIFLASTILTLLMAISLRATIGLDTTVDNGIKVSEGNQLRSELLQREVDHLNWASQISAFLTDNTATDLVGEIATASNEQAHGISQINEGLEQIYQVIQKSTSDAEESAAVSEQLSNEAGRMHEMLARFTLTTDMSIPALSPPAQLYTLPEKPAVPQERDARGDGLLPKIA